MSFVWDEAAIKKLSTLVAQGLPTSEIARRFRGLTRNSIIGKCARLGIKLGYKKWPADADATLRRLWAEGWSTSQIASELKLQNSGSVSWRAAEIGLPPRRQGSKQNKPTLSALAPPAPMSEPDVVVPLPAPMPASEPRADGPLHFLDGQSGRCRFPLWSNEQGIPIEAKFVCAAPAGSSAYCPEHVKVCFGIGTYYERAANKLPREAA